MYKTGYFSHPDCRLHEMGAGHPECPERLDAIEERLLITGIDAALQRLEAPQADPALFELAHTAAHVSRLRALDEQLQAQRQSGGERYAEIDGDTLMNADSWRAVQRSAGAALAAVDAVLAGELRNAFCAVRPPGHHAERDAAMGFCFINNVALAARYALERHGLRRVAIADFDVHHGNGTEDIVAEDPRILMVGIYQHPFYPEGGARSDAAHLLNVPVPAYTAGSEIREIVEQAWMPRLHAHRPELILVSAGFDGHREDDMAQLGMVEADYAWITERLMAVADQHARGRLVSCLEGGYNLSALGRSVEAHLRVLADV